MADATGGDASAAGPRFSLVEPGVGLYLADGASPAAVASLYYARLDAPQNLSPTLDAATAWAQCSGAWLFAPAGAAGPDPATTITALGTLLQPGSPAEQWIVWTQGLDAASIAEAIFLAIGKAVGPAAGSAIGPASLPFANLGLQIDSGVAASTSLASDPPALMLQPVPAADANLTLQRQGGGQPPLSLPGDTPLLIPLAGPDLGCWTFALRPDAGSFYALFTPEDQSEVPPSSAELRYFLGSGPSVTTLRFPVLLGANPDPTQPPPNPLPLLATIDPLRPMDSRRTRFAFDLAAHAAGGLQLPSSHALRSSAGAALRLEPQAEAGFALAQRPGASGNSGAYLTPAGEYAVSTARSSTGLGDAIPIANDPLAIMCGVFGSEVLLVAEGDGLRFGGERPAYADASVTGGNAAGGPLSGGYTTSWVEVVPGPNSAATFPGPIKQSFCAQAAGAVYYTGSAPQDYPFPVAIGARIADLSDAGAGQALPMAAYGYVYHSDATVDNPNPDIAAAQLSAYEAAVLSKARFGALAPDRCLGPLFFDMERLDALAGGYVRTPQGLLVGLNDGEMTSNAPAGSWRELLLARSPQDPAQLLRFNAGREPSACPAGTGPFDVVSPYLSTALLDPSGFLVVADKTFLGSFDNEIRLGEYAIEIAVAKDDVGPSLGSNCVLLFKLARGSSLAELAKQPQSWTDSQTFVGTSGMVQRISGQIQTFLSEAEKSSHEPGSADYFSDFVARMDDPDWTGIVALNAALDYQKLPADIQMLLCGMRSPDPLRCHHFGITTNATQASEDPAEAIGHSSLFGLVHYAYDFQQPFAPPIPEDFTYDFQTLTLMALFDNSVIKRFASRIAFSLGPLFGNPASLTTSLPNDRPQSNTIVIDGALQVEDGVTRVVFASGDQRGFSFPRKGTEVRALSEMVVGRAGLAPVTHATVEADGARTVELTAAFTLDGALGFNAGTGADLFSYGVRTDSGNFSGGLGYTGYAFTLVSEIPETGPTLLKRITPDLSRMLLDPAADRPRPHSLLATLPLKMLGFSLLSAKPDKSLLVTGIGLGGVGPTYAIRLQMTMGTLGGLSTLGPLEGELLLGWIPGGSDAVADRVGLLLVPPPSMTDGSFHLQGVVPVQYGAVELLRPSLDGSPIYVLVLNDVVFTLGSFPLSIPETGERSLTFFGKPAEALAADAGAGGGINLAWFLGKPDLSDSARTPVPARGASTSMSLAVTPAVYVAAGLKVDIDLQASSVVDSAVTKLSDVPLSTRHALSEILAGTADFPVTYDPSAGVSVAIQLQFPQVGFEFVFSDPYVYGARLSVMKGKKEKPKLLRDDGGKDEEKKGVLSSLEGFALEIAYRKISEGLGAWSASFTIKGHIGSDEYYAILPTIGLVIYTNGDFRIDIGWPFAPDGMGAQPLALQFTIGPIPVRAAVGLYLAKLRSADAPGVLGKDYAVIWRFGLGLSFGINADFEKGPMSLSAGLIAFAELEGFLASRRGDLTEKGADYVWVAGQFGIEGYISGEIDLKILAFSISITATMALQIAYETAHSLAIRLAFRVSIEVEFRILFIKISFSFEADLEVSSPIVIGSGPVASIAGPNPPEALLQRLASPSPKPRTAPKRHRLALGQADPTAPTDLTLYFVLHPAVVNGLSGAEPQAVATLLMQLVPDGDEPDDFATFAAGLGRALEAEFGAGATVGAQLSAIEAALASGAFDGSVGAFLEGFRFRILPGSGIAAEANFVAFPMLPQLMLGYNGRTIAFDGPALPGGYAESLKRYFDQLAQGLKLQPAGLRSAFASAFPASAAGLVCTDLIVLVARQLIARLRDVAAGDTGLATFEAVLGALTPKDFANLAGFMSRFAMHGLRLPSPGSQPFGAELLALYALTGQEVALEKAEGGDWITGFTLGLAPGQAAASSWIAFGPAGTDASVAEKLPEQLVLDAPVTPSWITSENGFRPLPAMRSRPATFYLGQALSWTPASGEAAEIRPISSRLMDRLGAFFADGGAGASAQLKQVAASNGDGLDAAAAPSDPLAASPALFIPLRLRKIASLAAAGTTVFRLLGTDDATRALLERLIAAKAYDGATLSFLAANGSSSYVSKVADSGIVLAKSNLSTLSEPPTQAAAGSRLRAAAEQPPVTARLADVASFLELVWELSVVHADGFYLFVPDLPETAFDKGDAEVALVASFGAAASSCAMQPWTNSFVLASPADPRDGAIAAFISDSAGQPWKRFVPGTLGGLVGFELDWPASSSRPVQPGLDAAPTAEEKAAYAEALYSLLQYRIDSVTSAAAPASAPTNWSLPVGPNQATKDADWLFSNAVALAPLLGQANRYGAVGATANFEIRLLDLYGNVLPTAFPLAVPCLYNDRLVGLNAWPGLRSFYGFSGSGGSVTLTLLLDFDPAKLGTGTLSADDPVALGAALAAYGQILDQLTDPLQAQNPSAGVQVETSLAAAPLDETATGASLRSVLTGFAQTLAAYLRDAIAGNKPAVPAPARPAFALDPAFVAKLPSDIFELSVDLAFFRAPATIDPNILAELPAVQRVVSSLAAAVSTTAEAPAGDGPDLQITAFAQAFEDAWYGFDGGTGQLKLAQGLSSTGPQPATADGGKALSLWCVRVGAGSGIGVAFANSGADPDPSVLPRYFAPRPLSTQLVTRSANVRLYRPDAWTGTGADVVQDHEQTFSGIDIDDWGRQFVAAVDALFGPLMAAAIATLDPARYASLAAAKESLADAIMPGLTPVLIVGGQDVPPNQAGERFRQALLQSLSSAYTLSSIVEVPAAVTLAGSDEPAAPPMLYGKIGASQAVLQAVSLSAAKLQLAAGTAPLDYLVSARDPAGQAYLDLRPEYDVAFLEHAFEPDRKRFGYEPSSWLSFIVPAYKGGEDKGQQALNFPLGQTIVPIPLRVYPEMPAIASQKAALPDDAAAIADALLWSYGFDVVSPMAAQDELTVLVLLNDPPAQSAASQPSRVLHAPPAGEDDPQRPAPVDLFEALARFAFEYPQLEPYLARLPAAAFTGAGAAAPLQALARFGALLDGAVATWAAWLDQHSQARAKRLAARLGRLGETSGIPRAAWRYVVDFSRLAEEGRLAVTRSIDGADVLPPWPAIAGYDAPPPGGDATADYLPAAGAAPAKGALSFGLPQLFAVAVQSAHVMASVTRNAKLFPPGLPHAPTVDPRFVYTTPYVEVNDPVVPLAGIATPIAVGAGAATLSAAVDELMQPFAAGPLVPGVAPPEMRLTLDGGYSYTLADGGKGQRLPSRLPIFLTSETLVLTAGDGAPDGIGAFKRNLVNALVDWRTSFQPSEVDARIELSLTLFADFGDRPLPLVRLGALHIPVGTSPDWWS